MHVTFVTPAGAFLGLTAAIPLAVFVLRRRRMGAIERALGLEDSTLRALVPLLVALVFVPMLLGVAAAQPVIERSKTAPQRTDAQAFIVVDVSRSMLAAAQPGAPTRFERALDIALALRRGVPEVPIGIATMTDRVLPHLLPTTDARVFEATLTRAIDIEHPPPGSFYLTVASNLNSLVAVAQQNYFLPTAKKRALLVLTDGESQPVQQALGGPFASRPKIETVFVHLWDEGERIYATGVPEEGYRPDPRSTALLEQAASLVGGKVVDETDIADAVGAIRASLGEGKTVPTRRESDRFALMPFVTLAALVPLLLVVAGRNLWWGGAPRGRRIAVPGREGAKVSEPRGVAQPG